MVLWVDGCREERSGAVKLAENGRGVGCDWWL